MYAIKPLLTGSLMLLSTLICTAQFKYLKIMKADYYAEQYAYLDAIILYQQVLEKDSANAHVLRQLGHACRLTGNTHEAERWYNRLLQTGKAAKNDTLLLAKMLLCNNKTEAYVSNMQCLDSTFGQNLLGGSFSAYLDSLTRDSKKIEVGQLNVNTPYSEFAPSFFGKNSFIHTGTYTVEEEEPLYPWNKMPYLNLYIRNFKNPKLLTGRTLFAPKLFTGLHEGSLCFVHQDTLMFYTRNASKATGKSRIAAKQLQLCKAYLKDDVWMPGKALTVNLDGFSTGHPAADPAQAWLYFVSNRPGGFGGTDLYKSQILGDSLGAPINLGQAFNTPGNEMFPYVDANGQIYFATDGRPGFGGLDIFVAKQHSVDSTQWHITNMGSPINSHRDDFGFIMAQSGKWAYLASDRQGGQGNDDIYYVKYLCKDPRTLKGIVRHHETGELYANALVMLLDTAKQVVDSIRSGSDGAYSFNVSKCETYAIKIKLNDYEQSELIAPNYGDLQPGGDVVDMQLDNAYWKLRGTAINAKTKQTIDSVSVGLYDVSGGVHNRQMLSQGGGKYGCSLQPATLYRLTGQKEGFLPAQASFSTEGLPRGYINQDLILQPKDLVLNVTVLEKGTNTKVQGAKVVLTRSVQHTSISENTNQGGNCSFDIAPEKGYYLEVEKVGYFGSSVLFDADSIGYGVIEKTLYVEKLEVGKSIKLDNIYYDFDKWDITDASALELDKLCKILEANPSMSIELGSHTDSRGMARYNLVLSHTRALSAINYLIDRGIDSNRLEAHGYGENRPVNSCTDGVVCTDEQHQENRRTEFTIISF